MSLKIWLPLNGNLKNQGLLNISMTNVNATVADDGKIGKCYYFNGTNARIYANNVSLSNSEMSGCCWIKAESLSNSSYPYLFSLGSNTSGTGQQIGVFWYPSRNSLTMAANGSQLNAENSTLSLNTWYHICFTYKGNSSKLYINGKIISSRTNANSPKTQTCFCIGARSNSTSGAGSAIANPFQGWINDIRIYDHCLSEQEIKKIAQGLILHYPFNNRGFGKENLLIGSHDFSSWYLGSRWTKSGNIITYSAGDLSWNDLDSPTILWSSIKGKDITFSCEIRSDNSVYTEGQYLLYCQIGRKSNATGNYSSRRRTLQGLNINTSGSVPTTWKKYSRTIKNIQDSSFTGTYNGGGGDYFGLWFWSRGKDASVQIKNIKLQISDTPTPWNFNSSDTKYTALGLNNTRIADISGFGNNGTRVGAQFQVESGSPVYKVATHIDCKNIGHYITSVVLPASNYITYCFWLKMDVTNTQIIFIDGINHLCCSLSSTKTIIGVHNSLNTQQDTNLAFTKNNYINNDWNFFTIIKNDINYKVFINGIEESSTTGDWFTHNLNNLWIGSRSLNNTYNLNGTISDFRVYCTALSASDIKELYENRR